MKKAIYALVGVATFLIIAGCAQTTIMPEGNDTYSVVSNSSSEGYAFKDALNKGTELCQKEGKSIKVLSHKGTYQGASKDTKAMMGTLSGVASILSKGNGGSSYDGSSSDDYKVALRFKCVNQ